jgi:hypothetical protein
MRLRYFVWFGLLSVMPAASQDASLVTPALGFVFDANLGAIRPIRGIPGAALLGDPIDAGFPVASATISPAQDLAIAAAGADTPLRLIQFQGGGSSVRLLDGAMTAPDRTIFSPAGRTALLYQSTGRLQILTGLPGNPLARDLDISALNANPAAMAVSDDGAFVVLAGGNQGENPGTSHRDAGPIWLLTVDGAASQLALSGSTAAISFRRDSHDLLAVAAGGDVYLVRNPANPDYRMVYAGDSQTSGPVGVQFSWDGARAFTANTAGMLSVIDLITGRLDSISCGCRAAALEPLAFRNIFRLTPASKSPVMLLDASSPEARVWFVPSAGPSREDSRAERASQ